MRLYHFLYFFFLLNFVFYSLFSFLVVCVYRTRSAPICHCTSVLCAMKTTLAPSGWWMMQSLSSDAIFLVVVPGNMTPPHHPLHPTSPHSKHWLFGNFAAAGAATAHCFSDWCLCHAKLPEGQEWRCHRKHVLNTFRSDQSHPLLSLICIQCLNITWTLPHTCLALLLAACLICFGCALSRMQGWDQLCSSVGCSAF